MFLALSPPALKSETEQSLRPRPCFKCEVNTTGTDDIFLKTLLRLAVGLFVEFYSMETSCIYIKTL